MPPESQPQAAAPAESGLDFTAIAADIASGLAGPAPEPAPAPEQGEGLGASRTDSQGLSPPADPGTPTALAPSPAALAIPPDMPKSWKREMAQHWAGLSPETRAYIAQRESEASTAITGFKPHAENWNQVVQPFQPVFQQHPDVNPVQLMQQLLHGHISLANPQTPPEQRLALAARFLQHYGINPAQLIAGQGGQQQPDPYAARFSSVEQTLQTVQQALYQEKLAATSKQVEAFFADKRNTYAKDLQEDIAGLIQSGKANSLEEAYTMAQWLNPAVRAKVIADQQEEALKAAEKETAKATQAARLNVGARDNSRAPAAKRGSINDTIDAVVAKNYGTQ